jgi:hypothetical protein
LACELVPLSLQLYSKLIRSKEQAVEQGVRASILSVKKQLELSASWNTALNVLPFAGSVKLPPEL